MYGNNKLANFLSRQSLASVNIMNIANNGNNNNKGNRKKAKRSRKFGIIHSMERMKDIFLLLFLIPYGFVEGLMNCTVCHACYQLLLVDAFE